MELSHYQQIVLNGIRTETDNPQNWRLKKWINNDQVNVVRLIKDMKRRGVIDIVYVEDRGKMRRHLKIK